MKIQLNHWLFSWHPFVLHQAHFDSQLLDQQSVQNILFTRSLNRIKSYYIEDQIYTTTWTTNTSNPDNCLLFTQVVTPCGFFLPKNIPLLFWQHIYSLMKDEMIFLLFIMDFILHLFNYEWFWQYIVQWLNLLRWGSVKPLYSIN